MFINLDTQNAESIQATSPVEVVTNTPTPSVTQHEDLWEKLLDATFSSGFRGFIESFDPAGALHIDFFTQCHSVMFYAAQQEFSFHNIAAQISALLKEIWAHISMPEYALQLELAFTGYGDLDVDSVNSTLQTALEGAFEILKTNYYTTYCQSGMASYAAYSQEVYSDNV